MTEITAKAEQAIKDAHLDKTAIQDWFVAQNKQGKIGVSDVRDYLSFINSIDDEQDEPVEIEEPEQPEQPEQPEVLQQPLTHALTGDDILDAVNRAYPYMPTLLRDRIVSYIKGRNLELTSKHAPMLTAAMIEAAQVDANAIHNEARDHGATIIEMTVNNLLGINLYAVYEDLTVEFRQRLRRELIKKGLVDSRKIGQRGAVVAIIDAMRDGLNLTGDYLIGHRD